MNRRLFAVLILVIPLTSAIAQNGPTVVEPEALSKRTDLVGKEIEVDDRARFQFHPNSGYDQVFLKRAPEISCEIPQTLRPRQPNAQGVKVRGILKRENNRLFVEVSSMEMFPSDLDRFNRAIGLSSKTDINVRMGWVRWADRRVQAFHPKDPKRDLDPVDVALAARAREIEAELIRVESEKAVRDPVAHRLSLAERARSRGIPEPEPSAQAHRAFRVAISEAKTADDFNSLRTKIEGFLPNAVKPPEIAPDLTKWNAAYRNSPADTYRQAPVNVRQVLDHRLWADVVQAWLERRAEDDPKKLVSLSEEAGRLLPDRPLIASNLLEKGMARTSIDAGALRLSEVESMAKLYREKLNQPEKAETLYRAWLDDQRLKRLSPRDADGRLSLADQYEGLLNDRETALGLLRAAWAIDPLSKETAEAFRRRGFRKINDAWIEGTSKDSTASKSQETLQLPATNTRSDVPEPATPINAERRGGGRLLHGASREEVRSALGGRPNRRNYVASQALLTEQWIYYQNSATLYINFRLKPGENVARVVSYYSHPRTPLDTISPP